MRIPVSIFVGAALVLSSFVFAGDSDRDRVIGELTEQLQNELAASVDVRNGGTTKQMADLLQRLALQSRKTIDELSPDEKVNLLEGVRQSILAANGGEPMRVPVANYEKAIAHGNEVLRRSGIDFIVLESDASADNVPAFKDPDASRAAAYKKMKLTRYAISPLVAFSGAFMGGGYALPGALQGGSAAGLEIQFIALSSSVWNRFWSKFKFPGNVAVNCAYAGIVTSVLALSNYAMYGHFGIDPKSFLLKDIVFNTTLFVGSFGAMQIASSKLREMGRFTEFKRFALETAMCLLANFGRVFALAASGKQLQSLFGVKLNPLFGLPVFDGIAFKQNEMIGWSIQLFCFAAVTAPLWWDLLVGQKLHDARVRRELTGAVPTLFDRIYDVSREIHGRVTAPIRNACARALAGAQRLVGGAELAAEQP